MRRIALKTNEFALILMTLCFSACSPSASSPAAEESPETSLEQINYSAFPTILWVSEADGKQFYTAMLKVHFQLGDDGETTVAAAAEEPFRGDPVVTYGCDPGVVAVPEHVAFRKKAEIYLRKGRDDLQRTARVKVGTQSRPVFSSGGCPSLSTPNDPFLVPYPKDGESISISGVGPGKGRELEWRIPKLFSPFVLVRYHNGAMIPTPMRADLIILDLESRQIQVTYRSTFPIQPAVRKIEYRVIQAGNNPWKGETREAAEVRMEKEVQYLRSCVTPTMPPEPCSLPTVLPERAFFGKWP